MRFVLALLIATTTAAHADSISDKTSTDGPPMRFAVALNEPLSWKNENALALSAYASITQHQVIRLDVATWSHAQTLEAEEFFTGGDGPGGDGRYTDYSAAWMYFPRRAFDGPSLELGALVRQRSTLDYADDFDDNNTAVKSTMIGGRALAGWSWLFYDRAFISLQAGFSIGRESGTQTFSIDEQMPVTMSLHTTTTSGEAFMRFGVIL